MVRIDHAALIRGHTEPGEICELADGGPIPVAVASRLLDDAFIKAVVVDGTDVLAVSHLGRTIPARLRTALEELYPECCHEGCNITHNLEIDHNEPIEEGGPTALSNLNDSAPTTTGTNTTTTSASKAKAPTNTSSPAPDPSGADQPEAYESRRRRRHGLADSPGAELRSRRLAQRAQRALRASMSAGTTLWTSPTTPRSAMPKIGASPSLLTQMMLSEPFMPTMCWVAPEMPSAM